MHIALVSKTKYMFVYRDAGFLSLILFVLGGGLSQPPQALKTTGVYCLVMWVTGQRGDRGKVLLFGLLGFILKAKS